MKERRMRFSESEKRKTADTLKKWGGDISQGESEDKYFFLLSFCRLLGRRAPVVVPVWQNHFVLKLSFSLSLWVNVEK